MLKTTKVERDEWRKICEAAVKDAEWFPVGTKTAEPAKKTLALLDDIESLREALCQIIINTEDECDRAIAQAAVEEPR